MPMTNHEDKSEIREMEAEDRMQVLVALRCWAHVIWTNEGEHVYIQTMEFGISKQLHIAVKLLWQAVELIRAVRDELSESPRWTDRDETSVGIWLLCIA
jgi:hypothetical protein